MKQIERNSIHGQAGSVPLWIILWGVLRQSLWQAGRSRLSRKAPRCSTRLNGQRKRAGHGAAVGFENSNPLINRNEKGLFYSVDHEKFQIIFIWTVKNNQKKLITDAVKFPDFLSIYEEANIMALRINEWKEVCMMAEKRCYTVAELQEILGVSRPTVYSLLKRNEFRWIQLDGGKYRISKKSFDDWLDKQPSEE